MDLILSFPPDPLPVSHFHVSPHVQESLVIRVREAQYPIQVITLFHLKLSASFEVAHPES